MYSQGKGRCYRQGEHVELTKYLCEICPKPAEHNLESEDEKKLRLILSKAQQHQQQLKEQLTTGHIPLPRHKLPLHKKKAAGLSERMVSSYHDSVSKDSSRSSPDLMTRSLDSAMLKNSPPPPRNSAVGKFKKGCSHGLASRRSRTWSLKGLNFDMIKNFGPTVLFLNNFTS